VWKSLKNPAPEMGRCRAILDLLVLLLLKIELSMSSVSFELSFKSQIHFLLREHSQYWRGHSARNTAIADPHIWSWGPETKTDYEQQHSRGINRQ